ncbi:MAG: hypothetical protein U9Q62_04825 [Campylobacterota bacterium]|nr:hypothetical protein [Campylobacterota bacterium]
MATLFFDATLYERPAAIAHTYQVTKLPGAALSVPFYEGRVRAYRDYSDRLYPAMQPINSMDFVYAR